MRSSNEATLACAQESKLLEQPAMFFVRNQLIEDTSLVTEPERWNDKPIAPCKGSAHFDCPLVHVNALTDLVRVSQ